MSEVPVQGCLAYPLSAGRVKFRPPWSSPKKSNGSKVLVAPEILHALEGQDGGFQARFKSRRSPIMPSNGAAARADSGSGRWGAAEEGTSRSSAAAPRQGLVPWAGERGPASGRSVEEGEESAEAAAGKKRPSRANSTMGAERNFYPILFNDFDTHISIKMSLGAKGKSIV